MKCLLVSAAVILDDQERILLAQRPEGKKMAGLWEFPGGKVEPGESPENTLLRELQEELGITIQSPVPLTFASHTYEDFHLLMPLYLCRQWQGEPNGQEGQAIAWVTLDRLRDCSMPPADDPLVTFLQSIDWSRF